MRNVLRVVVIAATVATQLGAAPPKAPFVASSYAQPQRFVTVGGRRMNIYCSGTGSPAVVLEAGLGDDTTVWRWVQGSIARHTRVCSYDRAGMGFSDPTTSARDAGAIVSDLHALLRDAGVPPPYVLVGHSIAGLYVRLYADRYPNDAAGLVLVDPATEYDDDMYRRTAPASAESMRDQIKTFRTCVTAISTCPVPSLVQFKKLMAAAGCPKAGPADCAVNEVIAKEHLRASYWNDVLLERLAISKSAAQVHAEQRNYRSLPLVVLSAGRPDDDPGPIPPA